MSNDRLNHLLKTIFGTQPEHVELARIIIERFKSGNRFDRRPGACVECRWWDGPTDGKAGRCFCDPQIVERKATDVGCSRGELV